MGNLWKKTGGRLLVLVCCVILIAGLLSGCGGNTGDSEGTAADGQAGDSARTIVVEETNGTTVVLDESKTSTNAYKGMHLYSGNDVTVQAASDMTMLLDMDKYLYAEENTHFWLEASGGSDSGKTVIYLDEGGVLNRIKNPLENGSVYQVDTPNSTMAVRGTVFRVIVYKGTDGNVYTYVEAFDGSVQIDLKNTQGEYNGVSETFSAGQAAGIRGNADFAEFIVGEDGKITSEIDYDALPPEIAATLLEYLNDGETLSVDRETLEAAAARNPDGAAGKEDAEGTGTGEGDGSEEGTGSEAHVHNWQTVTVRQATCTQQGLVQSVCTTCGQIENQRTIAMKAHTEPSGWTVKKKATCTETGTETKSCTVCGKLLETRKTDVLDHKAGQSQTIDATCTEAGSVKVLCTVCGHTLEEHILEALGHQTGDWVVTQAADYGVEGSQTQYCTVCGEALNVQTIPALVIDWEVPVTPSCSHKEVSWESEIPADCENDGSRTGTCVSCGKTVTETIPALGHTLDELNWTVTKDAACEEAGEETQVCQSCNKTVTREIPARGHQWTIYHIVTAEDMKTLESGNQINLTASLVCDNCETVSSEPGHTITVSAGGADGVTYTCSKCGPVNLMLVEG